MRLRRLLRNTFRLRCLECVAQFSANEARARRLLPQGCARLAFVIRDYVDYDLEATSRALVVFKNASLADAALFVHSVPEVG